MNLSTEHDFIEKCKQMIESRLEWKLNSTWKNRDYEYLSELITHKTHISISVSTLKRIWLNSRGRIPHVSTLNALAIFLDYDNWNDFKSDLKDELVPNTIPDKKQKRNVTGIFIISAFVIVAVLLILFYLREPSKSDVEVVLPNFDSVLFFSKKTVTSGLPNSVVFYYDISGIEIDSAFIQQDWDKRKQAKIYKQNNYHTSIYYYPGYYTAKLVVNDSVIREHPLFITTDGWVAIYKKTYNQEIPFYLKNINAVKKGRLFVSMDDLKNNLIENDKDFLIGLYNARDFGNVNADSFTFETVIKNDPRDGGLSCQYSAITVEAQEGLMTTSFSEKGCTSNLFYTFGEINVNGSDFDLSAFGTDLSKWHKITYKVISKNVRIFLDDKEIHRTRFKRDIGKIISISYHFYGCGSVKEVRLLNSQNTLVYEEKF